MQVGSKRCHDITETKCLLPQLGSGPTTNTSGSGYYTVLDYQEILREAERRHIQVIPEITMPSHAHAAIKAMDARYEKFRKLRRAEEAREYLLSERGDQSRYFSTQMFSDNAINPCLESTFTFIDYVIQEMAVAHSQAQPLKVFHFGGNEVAAGAWEKSKLCGSLQNATDVSATELTELFFKRVAKITASRDLDIAGWADGLLDTRDTPFNLSGVANKQVYAHAWDNVWETGTAGRAYKLANSGFKVSTDSKQARARCSSVVRAFVHGAIGRRIDPSWGGPIELFLVPASAPRRNKGRGMCYPICGMVHIKEPLLLIGKSSPCGGSGFPLSLSEWSFTIYPTPYNRK